VSNSTEFVGSFLFIGGGLLAVSTLGWLCGIHTFVDFLAAGFAVYMLLRLTNALDAQSARHRR
jgi:hypothetical protein